jgi:transposase
MDSRDKAIEELRVLVAKQAAQIERQAAQIDKLTSRIGELEIQLAKAKKDSTTSSKPPSSDIAKPKPKQRQGRPKKRRQGGQAGHERHLREPLPPERVNQTIEYEIEEAERLRLGLTPTGDFDSIQHIELPDSPVHVTEHRLTVYRDADGNS